METEECELQRDERGTEVAVDIYITGRLLCGLVNAIMVGKW